MNRLFEERSKVINNEQIVYIRIGTGNEFWKKNNIVDTINIVQYNFKNTHYGHPIKIVQFTFFKIDHMREDNSAVAIFRVKKNYNTRIVMHSHDIQWLEIAQESTIRHFEGKPKPYWYEARLAYIEDLINNFKS